VNNLGPQTSYPVPEGILNYGSKNYLALTLWAQDPEGAQVNGLQLVFGTPVFSGYSKPSAAPQPPWSPRKGAY
jgi:hypothetical protein